MLAMAGGFLLGGCLYDAEDRCEGVEVYDESSQLCLCPKGYALTPEGCDKCGKNEIVGASACECAAGFSRSGATDSCEEAEPPPAGDAGSASDGRLSAEGEGDVCDTDTDCTGPDANFCDPMFKTCSITGCSLETNNCPDAYACCDVSAFAPGAPPVCIRDACPF